MHILRMRVGRELVYAVLLVEVIGALVIGLR